MSSLRNALLPVAAGLLLLAAAAPAGAAQLLSNGDFEAGGGSTLGWTTTFIGPGNADALTASDYFVCCGTTGSQPAYSNNHFVEFGDANVAATQTLSQGFDDLAGHQYALSFDLGAFGAGVNTMSITADGFSQVLIPVANNNADTTFHHYSYVFLGTGGHHDLSFQVVSSGPDNTDAILDNVSLTGDPVGRGAVPEPGTWALLVAGFASMGGLLRRRRITAVA